MKKRSIATSALEKARRVVKKPSTPPPPDPRQTSWIPDDFDPDAPLLPTKAEETEDEVEEEEKASPPRRPAARATETLVDEPDEESVGAMLADKLELVRFTRIVETIFDIDPEREHEQIMKFLTMSKRASQMEHNELVDALDRVEIMVEKAYRLHANARLALVNLEAEANAIAGQIHAQAVTQVDREFESGARKKKPTNADVEAVENTVYRDELRRLADRRERAEGAVMVMEGLVKIAAERAKDVRQMVASSRR